MDVRREEFFLWLAEFRTTCERCGVTAVEPGKLLAEVEARVRAVLASDDDRLLTLAQAARVSGYSEDHLGRLVRSGTIPNAGTRYRPRVRSADLPRRARRCVATPARGAYDPSADARALGSRR